MEIKISSLLLLGLCAFALAGRKRLRTKTEASRATANSRAPMMHWTYEEELAWPSEFANCGGTGQSPINIDTIKTKKNSKIVPIKFHNYDILPTLQTVTNDGHSLKVELTNITKVPFVLDATGTTDKYNFAVYHFHFGSANSQGSEHTIDTVRYPMELHMVHYNAKYENFTEAINHPDGLVVLGVLFVLSANDNPALTPLIATIPDIKLFNSTTHFIQETNLYALKALLPFNTKRFFRYHGSLTTPTCNEVVTWNVFEKNIKISESQINTFRTLVGADNRLTMNNSRPTQPLNGRTVYRSFKM